MRQSAAMMWSGSEKCSRFSHSIMMLYLNPFLLGWLGVYGPFWVVIFLKCPKTLSSWSISSNWSLLIEHLNSRRVGLLPSCSAWVYMILMNLARAHKKSFANQISGIDKWHQEFRMLPISSIVVRAYCWLWRHSVEIWVIMHAIRSSVDNISS